MSNLLATKLRRPAPSPKRLHRPHLIQRLNDGLDSGRQVTLVSAQAGFGKRITYLGLLAHGLDVAHSIALLLLVPIFGSAIASTIGAALLAVGGTLQLIWYPLVDRRLIQLGRNTTQE